MAFELPEGWTLEKLDSYGVVIRAEGPDGGYVTVNEKVRNFVLGMSIVRDRGEYSGRGWKDQLYADAVAVLVAALDGHSARAPAVGRK